MQARERIYRAMDRRQPDRVPVVPKIWVDLGARLTGTDLVEVIRDPLTALRVIAEAGRQCRVDGVRLFHFPPRRVRVRGAQVFEVDEAGAVVGEIDMAGGLQTHLKDAAQYDVADPFTMAYHHYWTAPTPIVADRAAAGRIAVPDKTCYAQLGWGARQTLVERELGEDIAVLGDCSSATMAFYVCLRGMSQAMFDLIESPELVHSVMEKGVAIAVEKAKFNVDHGVRVLRLNDSVGNMSVISPRHWRAFVFPHMKAFCDEVHHYAPDARIYCHICGNILPIVDDLVATGLDGLGPLDPLGGFSPGDVRRRVGNAVALMGGVDTLSFVRSTPAEVRREARRCMDEAGREGGFILGSGCVVPRTAQRETLAALREAAEQYGQYEQTGGAQ